MALPTPLYQRLRAVLMRCDEFTSDAALRAVFVPDELAPFRAGLPGAGSTAGRVDAGLAYLVDRRLADGRPALPLFLAALGERYAGDALAGELDALAGEVSAALAAAPAVSAAPPPAAALGSDMFARYEAGARELLRRLGPEHPGYSDAGVWQQRLHENLYRTRLYGDTETRRAERAEIVGELNRLAQAALFVAFNELCGLGAASPGGGTPPPTGGGTYNVQIGQATGVVIGDNAQVTQQFGGGASAPAAGPVPDLAGLRGRLARTFDDAGLDALCLDHFTAVYDRFARGMRQDEKITLLLDYCRREAGRLERLRALLGSG